MKLSKDAKIFIAGHRGMVGSAVLRKLEQEGFTNLLTATRNEVDLTRQAEVEAFFEKHQPDVAFIAAAKVGGIHANNEYPAEFLFDNLAIAQNTIDAAYRSKVGRVLFLGSSCIYPREAPQPIKEEHLLTSPLEKTNEAYAIAKIAGLKLCQYYRKQYGVMFHSAMPTNLYGPGDNYHPENSHVLPALIRRFHEAKEQQLESVIIWGTGKPRREFLHVDDLAAGCLHLLELDDPLDWYNLGSGEDISILEVAKIVKETVGFTGEIKHDLSKPDGTMRKCMTIEKIVESGWQPKISLEQGIADTYQDFLARQETSTLRS